MEIEDHGDECVDERWRRQFYPLRGVQDRIQTPGKLLSVEALLEDIERNGA